MHTTGISLRLRPRSSTHTHSAAQTFEIFAICPLEVDRLRKYRLTKDTASSTHTHTHTHTHTQTSAHIPTYTHTHACVLVSRIHQREVIWLLISKSIINVDIMICGWIILELFLFFCSVVCTCVCAFMLSHSFYNDACLPFSTEVFHNKGLRWG